MSKEIEYNPHKNEKAISIIEQEDGNFIGECFKNGKMIKVREVDPQSALIALITHA